MSQRSERGKFGEYARCENNLPSQLRLYNLSHMVNKSSAMTGFTLVFLLCALRVFVAADLCQNNFTLGEFPKGILADVVSIATTGTIASFVGCKDVSVVKDNIKFWFNNRSLPQEPVLLNPDNPSEIDPNKPVKILIGGWLCNITNDRMPQLRDAYLHRYDANVIRVDWFKYSYDLYANSFCTAPKVAKFIGAFICNLKEMLKIDLNQIQVVGHSMGGQISGLTGQEVKKQCGAEVGRITALDPAGPLYQQLPASRRLDASDALFVDVIHSNEMVLGFAGSCGDADFFPNCGTHQLGCLKVNLTDISSALNMPVTVVSCSHLRSIDYMVESINPGENKFVANSCELCPLVCVKDVLRRTTTLMGQDCPTNPPADKFVLTTNSQPPFATGK